MTECDERCPFLIPVMADRLWVFPVPAYCRRPNAGVHVPSFGKFMRVCLGPGHTECPGYRAAMQPLVPTS
ncbi:MAG TPA: hypothetical protein VFN71_15775 [Methylomirabilota bacterium]|nr:hypothetical protein [Methylomirabilota bacterium]